MRLVYFVHDLADAAVARRVRMLAPVDHLTLIGFRRSGPGTPPLDLRPTIEVGRTFDASFLQRLVALALAVWGAGKLRPALADADVIVARQLEMLALAMVTRRRGTPVIYECLDIHRLMLKSGLVGILLRSIERSLMRGCAGLITSSPAFITNYFELRQHYCPNPLVVENKVLRREIDHEAWSLRLATSVKPAPPWQIGWFGILRCRRSLCVLAELLKALPGLVEVVLRGRPSRTAIPDFDDIVRATPGMRYEGPYDRAVDLRQIYANVHFVWSIDFFEYPGNSEWLLPNRLYEGSAFGCVPLALSDVETGRWLQRHGCGVLFTASALEAELVAWFETLEVSGYRAARKAVEQLNLEDIVDDDAACARLVQHVDFLAKSLPT